MRNILIALALAATPAFAHEGGAHLKGVVTAVSPDHITVKAADGHETIVTVTDKTQFVRGSAPAKISDVKEGERVVVHARKGSGGLEAAEVHLGAQQAKRKH